jgi:hypothetical protein
MIRTASISIFISLVVLFFARALGVSSPAILSGLLTLPLIYFPWRATIISSLLLSLFWESSTPLKFGEAAVPFTVILMLLQILARHQLRSNILTRGFAAILLQSAIFWILTSIFPPKTFLGAVLLGWEALWQLACAAVIGVFWCFVFVYLAKRYCETDLKSTIKSL